MPAKRVPVRLCDLDRDLLRRIAWELACEENNAEKRADLLAAAVFPSENIHYVEASADFDMIPWHGANRGSCTSRDLATRPQKSA